MRQLAANLAISLCVMTLAAAEVAGQGVAGQDSTRAARTTAADSAKSSVSVQSLDTLDDTSLVHVRIQQVRVAGRPINDTLLVTLQGSTRTVGGFDLRIALVSPHVRIVSILRGELLDSCQWEYFSAKELPVQYQPGRPRSVWQAVALAQAISDPKKPHCFGLNREASVLKMVLSNSHVLQMPETTAALFFWWEDCTDNVLSGPSGAELFMSLNVLDYFPVDIQDVEGVFPNHKGALRQCVNPRSANKPKRLVSFHNGGVEWRAGATSSDSAKTTSK